MSKLQYTSMVKQNKNLEYFSQNYTNPTQPSPDGAWVWTPTAYLIIDASKTY